MSITIIAAMARDRTIGKNNTIPWRYQEDMKFFKMTTMGSAMIVGRKTFESFGRPLPGRDNIVVTNNPGMVPLAENVIVAASLDQAVDLANARNKPVFVIGGSQIYTAALPIVDKMIITYIPEDGGGGDTFFPEIGNEWHEVSRQQIERVLVVWYDRVTS